MSVTQSSAIDQLAAALCKAQQQVEGAKKDSENPFFRSRYADLASVWLACRDALTSNGLSVAQFPGYHDGVALLTTVLLHSSGQWMAATAGAPLAGKTAKDGTPLPPDAQSVGAATTYLRRFALAAVAGVVQEDDDGESAAGRGKGRAGVSSSTKGVAVPKEPVSQPPTVPLEQFPPQLGTEVDPLAPGEKLMPMGQHKGAKLGVLSSNVLLGARTWMTEHKRYPDIVQAIEKILAGREGE